MKHAPMSFTAFALLIAFALMASQGFCASAKSSSLTGKVNINTATEDELSLLPRIGTKVAQRIIEYRKANGPFKTSEELKNVKGIGDKMFERLAGLVKISGTTDLTIAPHSSSK